MSIIEKSLKLHTLMRITSVDQNPAEDITCNYT